MATMRLLTNTILTTSEDPHSLTFRIERDRGWLQRAVGVAIVFVCFWQAHRWQSPIWLGFGLLAVIGMVSGWLHGAVTVLTVTSSQLATRGNVGRMFSTEILIPAADVVSLEYDTGAEGDPSGLYVKQEWKNTCILSGISRQQSEQIVNEIYRRFPEIAKGDGESRSVLFGNKNELITLGLSQHERAGRIR